MGLDVSGIIIVGIFFEKHISTTTKTYYDKNTGKPYQEEEEVEIWEAKGIPPMTSEQLEEITYNDEVQFYCNYEKDEEGILGIKLDETSLRSPKQGYIHQLEMDKIIQTMFDLKQKYPNAEVKLYNFLSVSC